MRGIFGPKRDEVTGEWRKLRNKELYDLHSSPNIVLVIKTRRMRWAGHVENIGRGEVHRGFWWGNLSERDHLQDPGIERRLILLISKMALQDVVWRGEWTGLIWLRIGIGGWHL